MKLEASLEIINNTANQRGCNKKNPPCFSQLSFAKDPASGKFFLLVKNDKKPNADKFRIANNVQKIYKNFVHEGKATLALKDPNFNLAIAKANPRHLDHFLKLISLASKSENIETELNKLQLNVLGERQLQKSVQDKPLKKPITTLTVKSRSEYFTNYKSIISQNLNVNSRTNTASLLNLTKLVITTSDLRVVDKTLFELKQLVHLDLSQNKLPVLDDFELPELAELILSQNEIARIGRNIRLPKLVLLDMSFNKLTSLNRTFCHVFKHISRLKVNNNQITSLDHSFGLYFNHLTYLYMNSNQLVNLPYSFSYIRFDNLELHENPFDQIQTVIANQASRVSKFPTLVELCARHVVNNKIKYGPREIPRSLCEYMDFHNFCMCGRVCFDYHFKYVLMMDQSILAKSFTYLTSTTGQQLPLNARLCSFNCFTRNNSKLKFRL